MKISAAQPVAALARIRARSDGEAVLWWWQGEVLGKRPGEIARHHVYGYTGVLTVFVAPA